MQHEFSFADLACNALARGLDAPHRKLAEGVHWAGGRAALCCPSRSFSCARCRLPCALPSVGFRPLYAGPEPTSRHLLGRKMGALATPILVSTCQVQHAQHGRHGSTWRHGRRANVAWGRLATPPVDMTHAWRRHAACCMPLSSCCLPPPGASQPCHGALPCCRSAWPFCRPEARRLLPVGSLLACLGLKSVYPQRNLQHRPVGSALSTAQTVVPACFSCQPALSFCPVRVPPPRKAAVPALCTAAASSLSPHQPLFLLSLALFGRKVCLTASSLLPHQPAP